MIGLPDSLEIFLNFAVRPKVFFLFLEGGSLGYFLKAPTILVSMARFFKQINPLASRVNNLVLRRGLMPKERIWFFS